MALSRKLSRPLFIPPALHSRPIQNIILFAFCLILLSVILFNLREPEKGPLLPYQIYPQTNDSTQHTVTEFLPASIRPETDSVGQLCDSFPRHVLSRIQPVLKTGHGDDKERLNAQMDSTSACFTPDELIVFSDLDEEIRDHHAIDILAHLPSSHYNATAFKMWEEYLAQKEMQTKGTLDTEAQEKHINGWALDKFKFLPMMERAWAMKPDRDFYVFYETDTYIFWDNLFRFLQLYDPDANIYMGSPSPGRRDPKRGDQGTLFANGGPGYVISRGAMKTMLQRTAGSHGQYIDGPLSMKFSHLNNDEECCGDSVLGWVLWELGIPMHGHWPMFSDYGLHEIPFNDQHWCQPLISLHKTSPKDMVDLFRWEFSQHKTQRPLLYSDVWEFHKPGTVPMREDWDGGRFDAFDPPPEEVVESSEQCSRACAEDPSCLQWKWEGRDRKKCNLLGSLQHGRERKEEKEGNDKETWVDFTSGWVEEHIREWKEKQDCSNIKWLGASIERKL
ncbi:glycosyltransferase family 31 protein [Trichoderma citrinoviride]|uniref:N-acetylgalactosaminide beta-1,3-galactosyltransferase n=1 Tax=Trichoderma citrinoviride TaxID=58853 RepID=A0A2T4AZL7_9HYPO|nr:glycosyltransferase family 31 protein [Trichoderma citrinoviride]PTB62514.1 glycosyltransferase family 31 protein [Trichoderma citrinoviride]